MKETIYTIPVTEAFEKDCECPICELKKRFEKDCVDYYTGPSLMEPEVRIDTNKRGFCDRHFKMMYETRAGRLGLGLMIDTYLQEQKAILAKMAGGSAVADQGEEKTRRKLFTNPGAKEVIASSDKMSSYLKEHEKECCICGKLDYTMGRYMEVIFHLYAHEQDFRDKIANGKGFCLPHFRLLIDLSGKYLSGNMRTEFLKSINTAELRALTRIEEEVDWFTKKFDYRNTDAPWGNSRDAVSRSIKKITGSIDVE